MNIDRLTPFLMINRNKYFDVRLHKNEGCQNPFNQCVSHTPIRRRQSRYTNWMPNTFFNSFYFLKKMKYHFVHEIIPPRPAIVQSSWISFMSFLDQCSNDRSGFQGQRWPSSSSVTALMVKARIRKKRHVIHRRHYNNMFSVISIVSVHRLDTCRWSTDLFCLYRSSVYFDFDTPLTIIPACHFHHTPYNGCISCFHIFRRKILTVCDMTYMYVLFRWYTINGNQPHTARIVAWRRRKMNLVHIWTQPASPRRFATNCLMHMPVVWHVTHMIGKGGSALAKSVFLRPAN